MGIYIKGMEMPTSCGDCKAFVCYRQWAGDVGDCFCGITKNDAKAKEKNADCPLVPVPPHGRLGDLDALYEKFLRLEDEAIQALKTTNTGSVNCVKWSAILTERTGYKFDIADAPTIIAADPAEEGKT